MLISLEATYTFCAAFSQILLIFYCIGHPARSPEKYALLGYLFIWTGYNLSLGIGVTHMTTHNVPRDVGHPTEMFWYQVWMVMAAGIGPSGTFFLLQYIKRKSPILLGTITTISVVMGVLAILNPAVADRRGPYPTLFVMNAMLPWLYITILMGYLFFTTKNNQIKRRVSVLLLAMAVALIIAIPYVILTGTGVLYVPVDHRQTVTLIVTLELTLFYTLAITKYGAFELGIEEAAEGMFSHLDDPVLIISNTDQVVRANPAAQSLFHIEEEQEQQISDLLTNYDPELREFESTIAIKKVNYVYFCSVTDITQDDILVGKVLVLRDITEEKRITSMKNAFMSTVSHELRTPLTSILGFTKLIQKKWEQVIIPKFIPETKKEERAKKLVTKNVGIIISEGERLTALINNVLDITKMEAGKIDWKYEKISLHNVIEHSILATQGLFAGRKEISLQTRLEEADIEIVADKDRLVQVMLNLISNAVKFTPAGTVQINVEKRTEKVLVSVTDSGIGMKREAAEKIFEKYQQVGSRQSSVQKGTGLGLPISREIIEGHGGKIWVESEENKGSSFFFTIPLSKQPAIG